ncbi:hypothetical protein [Hymenobacter sp. AT01-02]|uniref:hypothetical protein n=1 Tax=Hymenobacter sp. AT01-02 TaxID=1571877 RepID=UPI0005F0EBA2|nr:hypothetical protein [Hymenobacter sp. AT01-02]
MKHSYVLLLLCWLGGLATTVAAQTPDPAPTQPARLELDLDAYESDVHVVPMPEDSSVVLLVEKEQRTSSRSEFSFQKYDYRLHASRHQVLEVPREYEFSQICAEGTDVYTLFRSQSTPGKLWIAAFDTRTGELGTGEFDTKLVRSVHDLKALGGNLFVTVSLDRHLTILLLDLHTAQFRFLPSVYEPMPATLSFLADSVTKRAEFVLSESNGFKSRLQVKQLSDQGQLLRSEFVQAESERGLIAAQLSPGDSAARLLAGTYTLRDARYSQGLFAADLTAGTTATGQRRSLRFYDFLNLKHFFDFMKPSKVARMRERNARLKAESRQKRLHYRVLMHDMRPFEGGYVLVAEMYFPRYLYGNTYSPFAYMPGYYPGYNPRYNSYSARGNETYRTTQALVCSFDRHGNLLWDNSFLMEDVETTTLQEVVRMQPLPRGRVALCYLDEEKLRYKIIDRALPSPNDQYVLLATNTSGLKEKSVNVQQTGLQAWYGSRFVAYGYQDVRPEHGEHRNVFFLNAINFQ